MLPSVKTAAPVPAFAQPRRLLPHNTIRVRIRQGFVPGLFFSLLFFFCGPLPFGFVSLCAAQDFSSFPVISRLNNSDTCFRQFIEDVEIARRRIFNRERTGDDPRLFAETLTLYQYAPVEGDSLFSIAARCNIPYSAIASLNRIEHPEMLELNKPLLLPATTGLFIPETANTDLEQLLIASRQIKQKILIKIHKTEISSAGRDNFYFFPGDDFSPTERIFFLNPGFHFPLRNFRITSVFGLRQNPVTGNMRFHQGLDLASPEGTEVYAAAEGVVTEIGNDQVYGIYIVIQHGENWASLYGHLKKVETTLRSIVKSSTLIGRVGSTGQSTGPHLHFELRQNGKARDPGKLLFQNQNAYR
jgi:murein DD-endopeptidase MepM/ murein hydrolase activator NlpD